MKTAAIRSHGVQPAAAAGDPGVEGGQCVTVRLALTADPLTTAAKAPVLRLAAHEFLLAQPKIDTVPAVCGRIKAALTARLAVFDQVFIDITDATPRKRARGRPIWRSSPVRSASIRAGLGVVAMGLVRI